MGINEQSGLHPRTREHRLAGAPGAKLVVADWPRGAAGGVFTAAGFLGRAAGWCLGVCEQTVRGEQIAEAAGWTPLQQKLAGRLDAGAWPTRPLRIGVRPGHELSRCVAEASGSGGVQFVVVRDAIGDRAAFAALNLDALLVAAPLGLKVLAREHKELEAGWFDWGSARPLSYPSVFPTRLDCAQATIDDGPMNEADLVLLRAIAEAVAAFSRVRARLTPQDRWRGRKAIDERGIGDEAMERLASALQRAALGEVRSAHRAAARVLSAWVIRDQPGALASRERQLAELCARCAGQEAEVMLRLGAARLADMDDAGGRQALLAADRMLRTRPTLPGMDNSAFVQAELDQGRHDPRTVGRVAAGVVLACATLPVERLVFSQGDLLEEMRFSQWLVGRDQDRSLLHHLTRELVWQRRAEQKGLPSAGVSQQAAAQAEKAETEAAAPVRKKTRARSRPGSKSRSSGAATKKPPKGATKKTAGKAAPAPKPAAGETPARRRKAA